jgi:transposase-like protein
MNDQTDNLDVPSDEEIIETTDLVSLPGAKPILQDLKKKGKENWRFHTMEPLPKSKFGRGKPRLSDEEREQIVAEFTVGNLSKRDIAKNHGVTFQTVAKIIEESKRDDKAIFRVAQLTKILGTIYEKMDFLIGSINEDSLAKSNVYQRSLAFGILTDKMLALVKDLGERVGADYMPENADFETLMKRLTQDMQRFSGLVTRFEKKRVEKS